MSPLIPSAVSPRPPAPFRARRKGVSASRPYRPAFPPTPYPSAGWISSRRRARWQDMSAIGGRIAPGRPRGGERGSWPCVGDGLGFGHEWTGGIKLGHVGGHPIPARIKFLTRAIGDDYFVSRDFEYFSAQRMIAFAGIIKFMDRHFHQAPCPVCPAGPVEITGRLRARLMHDQMVAEFGDSKLDRALGVAPAQPGMNCATIMCPLMRGLALVLIEVGQVLIDSFDPVEVVGAVDRVGRKAIIFASADRGDEGAQFGLVEHRYLLRRQLIPARHVPNMGQSRRIVKSLNRDGDHKLLKRSVFVSHETRGHKWG